MAKWYKGALCANLHSEMFYPPLFKEDRISPESNYYRLGKLVCENCPIKDECLSRGMNEEYGLWGGWTPKERSVGVYTPPKNYLPIDKVHLMPIRSDDPIVPKDVLEQVRPSLKRRTKKRFQ